MKSPAFPASRWLLLAVLSAAGPLFAAPSLDIAWQESTPAPSPRAGYGDGVIGGKLVLIGGTYWQGSKGNWTQKVFCGTVDAFDPVAQRWEALPDAPVTVGYPASATVNGEIFILGGVQNGTPSADVWTLRKAGDHLAWARRGRMPEPRLFDAAATIGRTIYVLGGTREFEPFDSKGTCCTSRTACTTLWSLDTSDAEAQWKVLTPFPGKPRWTQRTVAVGQSIYAFGGRYQARTEDPVSTYNEVWRYDVRGNHWSLVAKLPEVMQGSAPVAINGQIVLVGASQTVLAFDPATLEYRALSALPRKASVDDFILMGRLLVGASGENTVEGPRRRSAWTFVGRVNE
jgi:N-acetylneuraminic acid mutarotase